MNKAKGDAGRQSTVETLGASEEELRLAMLREAEQRMTDEQSTQAYAEEIADAHMLMSWGGAGLIAGVALALAVWDLGIGLALLFGLFAMTGAIVLAAVVTSVKRSIERRPSGTARDRVVARHRESRVGS